MFCEIFKFNPVGNIIILNWFPKIMKEHLQSAPGIISDIKSTKNPSKNKFWMWPYNAKYNDEIIPDPNKYLIGFYYINKSAFIMPQEKIENNQIKDYVKSLITIFENEEELEESKKNNIKPNLEQAAGSGSESATKIRDKNHEEKFSYTGENFKDEGISKDKFIHSKQSSGGSMKSGSNIRHILAGNMKKKIDVSPIKTQTFTNIKTKIDKKTSLNNSDLPLSYKNEKTNAGVSNNQVKGKINHYYSKSIDTKENSTQNQQLVISATNEKKKIGKSPLPVNNFKIFK